MNSTADLSGKLAIDANGLNNLKQAAKNNSPEAIKAVAQQFEAVFMNMMLKGMRDAAPQDSPFDNEQSRTFTAMLDQQLSSKLAGKGLGLAEILAKQLSKGSSITPTATQTTLPFQPAPAMNPTVTPDPVNNNAAHVNNESTSTFKNRMVQHAVAASQSSGVPVQLILGQAALESGWGKHAIKSSDGTDSHNLFGIKAGGNWSGKVVMANTSEYINGVKQNRIEKFRAYDSYADSFKDFAHLISTSPRYKNVMANLQNATNYAHAMQQAGYASDPNYARKLASTISKVAST